ncbi:HEPN family nuclease, partial [Klebsiella pneumoniae]
MGNYSDFETDFVQRTLALIDQYNEMIEVQGKPFREQYNYTLTLNCLLGLIVLPKERALSFLPADRLTLQLKAEMGLHESQLPGPEMTLRTLILKMRNSVAHFSVQVISVSDEHLVDLIAFRDDPEDENA